jgi:hypothetical protein
MSANPIQRDGKNYYYEMTVYTKPSAKYHVDNLKNSGRYGFRVRMIKGKDMSGKPCYHIYSRSNKPGVD